MVSKPGGHSLIRDPPLRKVRGPLTPRTPQDRRHCQTVHIHRASVHQAAKLVAALLRVAGVTAGMAESNGSLPSGL